MPPNVLTPTAHVRPFRPLPQSHLPKQHTPATRNADPRHRGCLQQHPPPPAGRRTAHAHDADLNHAARQRAHGRAACKGNPVKVSRVPLQPNRPGGRVSYFESGSQANRPHPELLRQRGRPVDDRERGPDRLARREIHGAQAVTPFGEVEQEEEEETAGRTSRQLGLWLVTRMAMMIHISTVFRQLPPPSHPAPPARSPLVLGVGVSPPTPEFLSPGPD
jgi:hypothetical protein